MNRLLQELGIKGLANVFVSSHCVTIVERPYFQFYFQTILKCNDDISQILCVINNPWNALVFF